MTNKAIQLKVMSRLNKTASFDFDNIQPWQIIEAFNKGMYNWVRRQLQGQNIFKQGDESSQARIDDLQPILTRTTNKLQKRDLYYGLKLPSDYMRWKRVNVKATSDCCPERRMIVYLGEEANVNLYLHSNHIKPSFQWAETFATISENELKIYTNNEFDITDGELVYYRMPKRIQMIGVTDPYTASISTVEVECEFKDDVIEVLIDECVKLLAADINDTYINQIADNNVETNN